MSDHTTTPQPESSAAATGMSWAKLLRWSAVAGFIVIAAITILGGVIIPPLIVFAVIWLVASFFVGRVPKAMAILLLITFVLFIVMSLPFVLPTLSVPASGVEFILNIASMLAALIGVVAAVSVLRRRDAAGPSGGPRMLGLAGLGLLVVIIAVGLIAAMTYEGATAEEGDITLVTEDIEFDQESLQADGETVGVYVENKDQTLHTFTIDELDVNLNIPAGSTARVEFDAEPGSYTFYCVPHENDMEGTLEVG